MSKRSKFVIIASLTGFFVTALLSTLIIFCSGVDTKGSDLASCVFFGSAASIAAAIMSPGIAANMYGDFKVAYKKNGLDNN